MTFDVTLISGLMFGIEFVDASDLGDDAYYAVLDIGIFRILFSIPTYIM